MAITTAQQNKNKRTAEYNDAENYQSNWDKRLAAAMAMQNASPGTMEGYLVGSIFRQPFQDWVSKLWGVPSEKPTGGGNTSNFANAILQARYLFHQKF